MENSIKLEDIKVDDLIKHRFSQISLRVVFIYNNFLIAVDELNNSPNIIIEDDLIRWSVLEKQINGIPENLLGEVYMLSLEDDYSTSEFIHALKQSLRNFKESKLP